MPASVSTFIEDPNLAMKTCNLVGLPHLSNQVNSAQREARHDNSCPDDYTGVRQSPNQGLGDEPQRGKPRIRAYTKQEGRHT